LCLFVGLFLVLEMAGCSGGREELADEREGETQNASKDVALSELFSTAKKRSRV